MTTEERINDCVRRAALTLLLMLVLVVPLLHLADPWATRGVKPLMVELAALLLLGLTLLQAQPTRDWRVVSAFLRTGPTLPVILLVLYGAVSWYRSPEPGLSAVEWWRLAGGAALYLAVGHGLARFEQLRSLLDVLTGVAILAAVLGFLSSGKVEETRITGTFGNSQLLAGFLVMLLPLLVAVWFSDLSAGRKIAAQVAALLSVCALVQTQTRTSWLSASVALAVLGLLALFHVPAALRRRRTTAATAPALAVAVAALALFALNSTVLPTLQVRAATLADPVKDGSIQWRLHLWRAAGTLIRWRPVLGWGIGTFPHYYPLVRPTRMSPCLAGAIGPTLSGQTHNEYLQVGAELGLVGLGLYLGMLGTFFGYGFAALGRQKSGLRRLVLMASLAAVAGQAVDALSNPAWRFAEVSFLFWLMMGLGVAAGRPPRRAAANSHTPSTPPRFQPAWQLMVVTVTLLAMSGAWTAPRATYCPTPRHEEQGRVTVRVLRQSATHGFQPRPENEHVTELAPGQCVRYEVLFNGKNLSRCYEVEIERESDAGPQRRDLLAKGDAAEHQFCVPADACAGRESVERKREIRMRIAPLGTAQALDLKPAVGAMCGGK